MLPKSFARLFACAALSAFVAGCGDGEGNQVASNEAEAAAVAEGEGVVPTEAEAAAFANQAADAEAADTSAFGGNAAAGETGNAF